jgi:CRP-like cAMP-binding protein
MPRVNTQNGILASLSSDDLALIAPDLQLVDLPRDQRLERAGRALDYVYFLERGFACMLTEEPGGLGVDIGMIGPEGFVGVSAALDATQSAHDVQMLAPGAARRAPASVLREAMNESASFRRAIRVYLHRFLLQVMREAQVNARATLDARLVRCLLMMHDRVEGDEIHLTHDRLATMLGVRRAGVSVAAKKLERAGTILLHRGAIIVQDRKRLEESAGGAYGPLDRPAREAAL